MSIGNTSSENTLNEMRALVNAHVDKWIAAGKYALPDVQECLEFVAAEAAEALQSKLRLNPIYTRNTPRPATERDIAVELFDTMKMCIVYERIADVPLAALPPQRSDEYKKGLRRIVGFAAKALVALDDNLSADVPVLLGRVYQRAHEIVVGLGFNPLEIAREKLREMDVKRGFA